MSVNERFRQLQKARYQQVVDDIGRQVNGDWIRGEPKVDLKDQISRAQEEYTTVLAGDAFLTNSADAYQLAFGVLLTACLTLVAIGALLARKRATPVSKAWGYGFGLAAAALVVPSLVSLVMFWRAVQTQHAFRQGVLREAQSQLE